MLTKVLIVEDDKIVRNNLSEILRFNDFKVYSAEDGEEGFELAKVVQPDLIISDIMNAEM